MSDCWLLYVPSDPEYQPARGAAEQACVLLTQWFPQADTVASRYEADIVFFDSGQNWDGVRCPACGADAEPWWGDAMSAAAEGCSFPTLACSAICCGADVSLNEMNYGEPVAFGRFALEVVNPEGAGLGERIRSLEAVIGCELREVRRRV